MDNALLAFTIVGSLVPLLAAMTTLMWWVYGRGVAAGIDRAGRASDLARIDALERELAQTRAELAEFQSKRRRGERRAP